MYYHYLLENMSVYTLEEVATHNTAEDAWIIINNSVYNVTSFLDVHPGTRKPLLYYAGKDATKGFEKVAKHKANKMIGQYMENMCIGTVAHA